MMLYYLKHLPEELSTKVSLYICHLGAALLCKVIRGLPYQAILIVVR